MYGFFDIKKRAIYLINSVKSAFSKKKLTEKWKPIFSKTSLQSKLIWLYYFSAN